MYQIYVIASSARVRPSVSCLLALHRREDHSQCFSPWFLMLQAKRSLPLGRSEHHPPNPHSPAGLSRVFDTASERFPAALCNRANRASPGVCGGCAPQAEVVAFQGVTLPFDVFFLDFQPRTKRSLPQDGGSSRPRVEAGTQEGTRRTWACARYGSGSRLKQSNGRGSRGEMGSGLAMEVLECNISHVCRGRKPVEPATTPMGQCRNARPDPRPCHCSANPAEGAHHFKYSSSKRLGRRIAMSA